MSKNAYYLNQFISTTLSTAGGIDDSQTTGIKIASTSGVTTDKPGILCLSYSDPIDITKAEWISYTSIDVFNELQGVTRGEEGFSAKAHSNGVTVAFPISRSHINNLNTALSIGGVATNLVTGTIDDDTMATASASTLATSESIKNFVGTGWIPCSETWTRTGNHTFTVATDLTAKYRKGTKVRYKDGGTYEYGVIGASSYSSPSTTITLITNNDFAMAAATITDTYISYAENPEGFPQIFTYTPVLSATGGTLPTFSSVSGRFSISAGMCHYNFYFADDGGTDGSGANDLTLSIPISQVTVNGNLGQVSWYGTGTSQGNGIITWNSATTVALRKDITIPLTLDEFPNGARYLYGFCDLYL